MAAWTHAGYPVDSQTQPQPRTPQGNGNRGKIAPVDIKIQPGATLPPQQSASAQQEPSNAARTVLSEDNELKFIKSEKAKPGRPAKPKQIFTPDE